MTFAQQDVPRVSCECSATFCFNLTAMFRDVESFTISQQTDVDTAPIARHFSASFYDFCVDFGIKCSLTEIDMI